MMHMTATLTKWYEEHGRHEIFAGGKKVGLEENEHSLVLRAEDVNHGLQRDLDEKGIAKTAREEKKRERDEKMKKAAEDAAMAKLYREHVLGEKPVEGLVQINLPIIIGAAPRKKEEVGEEVGSFGD